MPVLKMRSTLRRKHYTTDFVPLRSPASAMLELGPLNGAVVRRETGEPPIWIASINSTALGEFLERDIAMRRVEELGSELINFSGLTI